MKLSLRNVGKVLSLEGVDMNETILSVKRRVHEIVGLSEKQQQLMFSGKVLEDSLLVGDYGIKTEDILSMIPILAGGEEISIYISDGDKLLIEIDLTETIARLKKKIDAIRPGLAGKYRICRSGKVLDDDSTLLENKIKAGSMLVLKKIDQDSHASQEDYMPEVPDSPVKKEPALK